MDELIKMLEDILEVDEGTLTADTILEEVDEWDSIGKLSLIAVAKKEYGKTLAASQMRDFVTVNDICKALQ